MKIDCQWVTTNLEAISCDSLGAEEARLAKAHIQECAHCRAEIESLEEIDVMVRKYVRHQMAVAVAPKRQRVAWGSIGAAAAVAIALVMAVSLQFFPGTGTVEPALEQALTAPAPAANPQLDKDSESTATQRSKPEEAGSAAGVTSGRPAPAANEKVPDGPGAPDFLITDPAGYSRTLEDYKGYVFFFGVWQPTQTAAIANIETVYRNFGSNTKLRIVGISNQRQVNPANTTFPLFYNQGSRLLNTASGEFLLLDQTGAIRLRGSLLTPSEDLVRTLRDALQPLGVQ